MSSNTPRLTDPRRLAGLILGVVAVFAVVVAATLVAKSRTARVEVTGPATSSADLRIKEVELEEVAGGVRWRLKAEQARVFEQEGGTALKKIAVRVVKRQRACAPRSRGTRGDEVPGHARTGHRARARGPRDPRGCPRPGALSGRRQGEGRAEPTPHGGRGPDGAVGQGEPRHLHR